MRFKELYEANKHINESVKESVSLVGLINTYNWNQIARDFKYRKTSGISIQFSKDKEHHHFTFDANRDKVTMTVKGSLYGTSPTTPLATSEKKYNLEMSNDEEFWVLKIMTALRQSVKDLKKSYDNKASAEINFYKNRKNMD